MKNVFAKVVLYIQKQLSVTNDAKRFIKNH